MEKDGGPFDFEGMMATDNFTKTLREMRMKYAEQSAIKPLVIANPLDPENMVKGPSGLWTPKRTVTDDAMAHYHYHHIASQWMMTPQYVSGSWGITPEDIVPKVESPFETNMMEALVGWKAWTVWKGQLKSSQKSETIWKPDTALVAKCVYGGKHEAPIEHCHCGIYGADDRDGTDSYVQDDDDVVGQVSGWGRYVRGEVGWRAQFAYPKNFYLKSNQIQLIDTLRTFHVPIYIEQPTLIYNPEEDGYEYGHDETNGNSGAAESSASDQAYGSNRDAAGDEED